MTYVIGLRYYVKKNSKLPALKDHTYPFIIEWLRKYDSNEKYGDMGFKFNNDLISIYKAVETFKARVKKFYDDEDELVEYVNQLIKAIRMKFNFHKNTIVDLQLIALSNSKVSVYNLSLNKEKYFSKSDLQLIAEYDGDDIDMG